LTAHPGHSKKVLKKIQESFGDRTLIEENEKWKMEIGKGRLEIRPDSGLLFSIFYFPYFHITDGQKGKEEKTMAKSFKTWLVPLLVGGLWFGQSVTAPAAHAKKIALLVGVGDYIYLRRQDDTESRLPAGDLRGPARDVVALKELLTKRFGFQEADIQVVLDQEATEENVRQALHRLVQRAEAGDVVLFYYSGHGSRRLESNYQKKAERDEADGWDETLVCADDNRAQGGYQGYRQLVDDELDQVFRALRAKTDNVIFISDSCHSGTVSRVLPALAQVKYLPPAEGEAGVGEERFVFIPTRDLREAGSEDGGNATLIAACLDEEQASDAEFPGAGWHGALTYALLNVLGNAPADLTYRQLMDQIRQQVSARFSQTPQLDGPGQDRLIFGGPTGGAPAVSAAQVVQVVVNVTGEPTPPPPPPADRADLLYVWLEGFGTETGNLEAELRRSPYFAVTQEPSWADRLIAGTARWGTFIGRVALRDGTVEAEAEAGTAAELVQKLRPALLKAYLVKQVSRLASAAPELQPEVDLEVVRASKAFKVRPTAYEPLGATVRVGDLVKFRFRAAKACYLTLVEVTPEGVVQVLFPNRYHPENRPVRPHQWYEIPSPEMGFEIEAAPPVGQEMVVALATEKPLELGDLRLKDVGAGMRALEDVAVDGARLFVLKEKRPDAVLPSTGFAVAYLLAELRE